MKNKTETLIKTYKIDEVNLFFVRNRNEQRVMSCMRRLLPELHDYTPNDLDIQDIYALALNSLPPRYTQKGSIVLREPVKKRAVEDAVRDAIETVRNRPNYSGEA